MDILEATDKDMKIVHDLFLEYQEYLGVELCFQDFERELSGLPGEYAPPHGAIFLAKENGTVIGCVVIRPIKNSEAELRRLYARPDYQGRGIGKRLFHVAMQKAEDIGYATVFLDTLPSMTKAKSLYRSYGFKPTSAYNNTKGIGIEYFRYDFD